MRFVVLDTSVVVAAARSRHGASSQLIDWLDDKRFETAISIPLALEYERALRREVRPDGLSDEDVSGFIDFMCTVSRRFDPRFKLRPTLPDPDDEFVLELAFAADVDYLVTHNVRDFGGSDGFGITVVTPGKLVHILRGES